MKHVITLRVLEEKGQGAFAKSVSLCVSQFFAQEYGCKTVLVDLLSVEVVTHLSADHSVTLRK